MPSLHDLIENFGITQGFGVEGPFGGTHTGIDIGTPYGTPVPALGEGTISKVFYDPIGGNQVKVRYDSGAEGWFAHLSEIYSQVGEHVSGQTIVAASGSSGEVTGPHLHYEVHDPAGVLVDPLNDQTQTYIGGGSSTAAVGDPQCPLGYHWDPQTQSCASWVPGGVVPNVPQGPTIPQKPSQPSGIEKAIGDAVGGAVGGALNPIGSAITGVGDRVLTGTRQLVIAGVVVAVIAALSVGGVRRTLS